jgi:hypothetical protein
MSRTHEALLRAEAKHESICSITHEDLDIEQKLLHLKLSREDLENQNLSELTQSLHSINKCLNEPSIALEKGSDGSSLGNQDILPVLLKRKRLVLELIDTIITEKNIDKIRSVLKHIPNYKIQETIEKHLSILYRKNKILKKEYRSIAVLDAGLAKTITGSKEISDTAPAADADSPDQEKASRRAQKSSPGHGLLSIIITASLLAIWGAAITLAHFLNFSVPEVQGYAFLVTLGFLLGILFRVSQKGGSGKKE